MLQVYYIYIFLYTIVPHACLCLESESIHIDVRTNSISTDSFAQSFSYYFSCRRLEAFGFVQNYALKMG